MKKMIFFISLLVVIFCSCKQKQILTSGLIQDYQSYQIKNIERIEGTDKQLYLYIIHAQRNDSTFYILEREYMPKLYYSEDKKIKIGSYYNFTLSPLYSPKEIEERTSSPFFAMNYLDYKHPISVQGAIFHVDWKYVTNSYTAKQLKALYYIP